MRAVSAFSKRVNVERQVQKFGWVYLGDIRAQAALFIKELLATAHETSKNCYSRLNFLFWSLAGTGYITCFGSFLLWSIMEKKAIVE